MLVDPSGHPVQASRALTAELIDEGIRRHRDAMDKLRRDLHDTIFLFQAAHVQTGAKLFRLSLDSAHGPGYERTKHVHTY
jgi:hypothetical protein